MRPSCNGFDRCALAQCFQLEEEYMPGMLKAVQLNSESTTKTGINIRVTAAAAISAVAVNIAPSSD